jgi:serine protease Do
MKRNPVAWAALIVSSAALLSSMGVLRPMPAAPKVTLEEQKTARALSSAYNAVAEFVRPSVVQISVQKKNARGMMGPNSRMFPFPGPGPRGNGNVNPKDLEEMLKKFFGPEFSPEKQQFGGPRGGGVGSGFVYDNRGHILTNNHVVEGADKITVTYHDGTEATAKVVGTDKLSDVAVIKVDNTSYPPLKVGDSDSLKVGDLVMAVGSPFELSQSVTNGIISATERNSVGINDFESFLQTDAAINPGNSGGPLVNMDGEVIGVNSAIVTGGRGNDGIGFAIPIQMASSIADQIIKDGKVHRARIGIVLQQLMPTAAKQLGIDPHMKGVLVGEIVPGSPADKAGLKQGDVIVGFNGQSIRSAPSFRLRVSSSEVGKSFDLTYIRAGKEKKTTIVPADYESISFPIEKVQADKPEEKKAEPAKTAINDFGLEVQPLTPELAKQLAIEPSLKGLLVSAVKDGSPAEDAGISEGDVITKIIKNREFQPVTSVKEFQELAASQDDIAVYVHGKQVGRLVTLSKEKKAEK